MRNIKIIASLLLASCVSIAPANAALLGGTLGGGSGGSSGGTSSGASSGGLHVNVPNVAAASVGSDNSGTQGNAAVLGGGGNTLNGLHEVLGGNSNDGVNLPGTGLGDADGTAGGATDTVNGVTGNGGTGDTIISGITGDGGVLGGGGVLGDGGNAGNGIGDNGGIGVGGAGGGGISGLGGLTAAGAACRQDTRGIVQLLNARYSSRQAQQWSHAAGVQIVKVPMCAQIKATVGRAAAGNASIGMMRGMAAADPLISTSLGRARTNASHVLGVGQTNGNLTVYVY